MPWIDDSQLPETVQKLDGGLRSLWMDTANRAMDEGYDEVKAVAVAWAVINKARAGEGWMPAVYWKYPLMRPGTYELEQGGTLELDTATIASVDDALNRQYSLGQPCAIVYGHGSGQAEGLIPASMVEDSVLYGALVFNAWMNDGITTGTYGLSVEAYRDYSSDAYTGGATFPVWPVTWAVLGADVQPAVPPGEPLAAGQKPTEAVRFTVKQETAPIRGAEPHGKEAEAMEELTKQIAALNDRIGTLEAAETELQAKLSAAEKERDDLKAAADAHQVEVQAAEIVTRTDKLMAAEVRPGARDKMKDKLTAAETPAAKLALLEAYEGIVEPVTVPAPVLQASAPVPDGEPVSEADKLIQAAEKLAADEKITFAAAMTRLNQTQKEG